MAWRGWSSGPRIEKDAGCLVARTGWLGLILGLGAFRRTLRVDPYARTIELTRVYLWFLSKTERVGFDQVRRIKYAWSDANPFTDLGATGNSVDCYTVSLNLFDRRELTLFSFYGDGAFQNRSGMPDWCYWSEMTFDRVGSQQAESKYFVQLLSEFTNAPLV